MNATARVLVSAYIFMFAFIAVFNTPYAEYCYDKGEYEFTGERGTIGLTGFNDVTIEATKENERLTVVYIDYQVLITELVALTVVFVGLYKMIK